jgi:hypothetical protein
MCQFSKAQTTPPWRHAGTLYLNELQSIKYSPLTKGVAPTSFAKAATSAVGPANNDVPESTTPFLTDEIELPPNVTSVKATAQSAPKQPQTAAHTTVFYVACRQEAGSVQVSEDKGT